MFLKGIRSGLDRTGLDERVKLELEVKAAVNRPTAKEDSSHEPEQH